MDEEEIQHLKELRVRYIRNLRTLQLQAADHGLDPPLDIVNGITRFEGLIQDIDLQLQQLQSNPIIKASDETQLYGLDFVDTPPEEIVNWYLSYSDKLEARHRFNAIYSGKLITYTGIIESVREFDISYEYRLKHLVFGETKLSNVVTTYRPKVGDNVTVTCTLAGVTTISRCIIGVLQSINKNDI